MVVVNTSQGPINLETPEQVAAAIDAGIIDLGQGAAAQKAIAGGPANTPEINPPLGGGGTNINVRPSGSPGGSDPQAEALRKITKQFNDGDFANIDEVVLEIARVLGVDRNQALRFLEVIRPDFTRTAADTTIVPKAPVVPADRPGPEDIGGVGAQGPQTRAALFADQEEGELRRRLIADQFGANLSPLAGRAAGSALNRFIGLDPLLEFASAATGAKQNIGQRFSTFADFAGGGRPTGEFIGQQLDLLGGVGGTSPVDAFKDFVPDFQTAARLGAQETLSGVNPRLARRIEDRFLREFAIRQAQQPEQFQTDDATNLSAQLQATRDRFRGFFQ